MNQAYAARENPVPGPGAKKRKLFSLEFISTKWPRVFFGVVMLQAILCLAFEAYVQFHHHPLPPRFLIADPVNY